MATELLTRCPECQCEEIAEGEPQSTVTCEECRHYHEIGNRHFPDDEEPFLETDDLPPL